MDPRDRAFPRPGGPSKLAGSDVVPSRAVLTELARGFLILQSKDTGRAAQFAATFLRERSGPRPEEAHARPRLPAVRRSATVWSIGAGDAERSAGADPAPSSADG